jgi:hypothetical protein
VFKFTLEGIMHGLEFTVFVRHSYQFYLQIHSFIVGLLT